MKAYSSCVGDGPFVTELAMTEEEKHALREAGHESVSYTHLDVYKRQAAFSAWKAFTNSACCSAV